MRSKKIIFFLVIILAASVMVFKINQPMTKDNAIKRTEKFIEAVNANKPEDIYDYLAPTIQSLISREGFVKNFAKERSYPYLTPLYLYLEDINLSEDKTEGTITCIVASRLPGEKMKFEIIFVNNNYYIDAFSDVADGSFIKKFEKLSS